MSQRFDALPEQRPARLRIGVVGSGRVGAVLGAALRRAGHTITATSAVSDASLERARTLLPDVPVVPADVVAQGCDLLVLAVPDDALEPLVAGLVATGSIHRGQLVAHTSGRHGLAVLDAATAVGGLPLALHPAMTFTGTPIDLERLGGACFGVTAPEQLRPVAEALAVEMGAEPVWIADESRVLYHAALAHGANHLVTLVNQTCDLLREAGVEHPARMAGPLLSAALDNALRHGDAALTGPVSRGDAGTVATHVDALEGTSAAGAYLALARATADRALASGRLRVEQAEALLDVLSEKAL